MRLDWADELYGMQWLAEGRPVLLIGHTGVGKTLIEQAIGRHAWVCGNAVMFMTVITWRENLTYLRYRDRLAKPDAFSLEDMGMRKRP